MRKGESLLGSQTATATLGISVEDSHKAKNKSIIWLSYTTIYHMPKGLNILVHSYLFIIANKWEKQKLKALQLING